jgi:hypothetical protein
VLLLGGGFGKALKLLDELALYIKMVVVTTTISAFYETQINLLVTWRRGHVRLLAVVPP